MDERKGFRWFLGIDISKETFDACCISGQGEKHFSITTSMDRKGFAELCKQPMHKFPQKREPLMAPSEQGVYIIRRGRTVLHVGRTLRGKDGLHQRLKNHIHGSSSFTNKYLKGNGAILRKGHTYQYLVVKDTRLRSLLEAYSIGTLCPHHIGLGE